MPDDQADEPILQDAVNQLFGLRAKGHNYRDPKRTIRIRVKKNGQRVATVTRADGSKFRVVVTSASSWRPSMRIEEIEPKHPPAED